MNLLLNELLTMKAHIGKTHWSSQMLFALEGQRPSQKLFGNPSIQRLLLSKNKQLIENRQIKTILQSFQKVKNLKKRTHFLIFNLEITLFYLSQAVLFIQKSVQYSFQKSPHILIVTGKLQSSSGRFSFDISRSLQVYKTQKSGLSNIDFSILQGQTVGGMLTNWKQVCESLRIYSKFKKHFESFLIKHNIQFTTYEKYEKKYQGLTRLADNLPDFIIITNPENNENLIQEAFLLKIPIIALVNTNIPSRLLKQIQYPIPGNNASPYFNYFCINLFCLAMQPQK